MKKNKRPVVQRIPLGTVPEGLRRLILGDEAAAHAPVDTQVQEGRRTQAVQYAMMLLHDDGGYDGATRAGRVDVMMEAAKRIEQYLASGEVTYEPHPENLGN